MKKELPVINGVGAVVGEVDVLDRVGLGDSSRVGAVTGGIEIDS